MNQRAPRSIHSKLTSVALLIALIALVASSCNVVRRHDRACANRLKRNDFVLNTFTDTAGAHFVWSRDTGKEKLLLIHGYTGTGQLQWSKTAKLLGDHYDAIMPDLLCHGRSTTVWNTSDTPTPGTNIDAQVAHVMLILDSLGVREPIAVVGNSYGGGVAARLAELHPERVKKLVLYDALASDYSQAMADSIARAMGSESMLAIMGTPTPKDLRMGIRLALYKNPPLPGFLLKQIIEVNVKPYRPAQITLIRDLMANEDYFANKRYDWRMPVYLIWGERDELIPNATGLAVMRRNELPADHWVTIPKTGHVANVERPKEFVRVLEGILAKP